MKKRPSDKRLRTLLWDLCKAIIRRRHGNVCYTCGKENLEGFSWQTGHMWAKAALGHSLKYDLRILRPQCYNCNMNLGGMGAVFYRKMLDENGKKYMDGLEKEKIESKRGLIKADWHWFVAMIEEYKNILNEENEFVIESV